MTIPKRCQRFKDSNSSGDVHSAEAEWDDDIKTHFIDEGTILDALDCHKIQQIKNKRTGVIIPKLKNRNNTTYSPARYRYTPSVMEIFVITKSVFAQSAHDFTGSTAIKDIEASVRQEESLSRNPDSTEVTATLTIDQKQLLIQIDNLVRQLFAGIQRSNLTAVKDSRIAIENSIPRWKLQQDDTIKNAVIKAETLLYYPVPRHFFVVLKAWTVLRVQLRLHLLCECGIHDDELDLLTSQPTNSVDLERSLNDGRSEAVDSSRTHLSNHPGYEVQDPTELCQKFAHYLLRVLKGLQVGMIVAGIAVPGLAAVGISNWFATAAQAFLNYNNQSFSDPYLRTMQYVAEQSNLMAHLQAMDDDFSFEDFPQPLDGPQYRRLQTLLEKLDPNKDYGNLTLIFGRNGRPQWVCKDHVERSSRDQRSLACLEDVVADMTRVAVVGQTAHLDLSAGELRFNLSSHDDSTMEQLYVALVRAPGINRVIIHLGVLPSEDKVKILTNRLRDANTTHIILDGRGIQNPGTWYMLLLSIMTNRRCQSLRLNGFQNFFDYATNFDKLQSTHRLRSLTINCDFILSQHQETLMKILRLCPCLRVLSVRTDHDDQLWRAICSGHPRLQYLEMIGSAYTSMVQITTDVQGVVAYTIDIQVKGTVLPPLSIILSPHLAILRLETKSNFQCNFEPWLTNLLTTCSRLQTIDLRVSLMQYGKTIGLLQDAFKSTIHAGSVTDIRRIVRLRSFPDEHSVDIIIKYADDRPIGVDTTVEMTGKKESNHHLEAIFRDFGSTIRLLVANSLLDDTLLSVLSLAIQNTDPRLELLNIDPLGLTDGVDIQRIVTLSCKLTTFTLSFSSLHEVIKRERATTFIRLFSKQVTNLILRGGGALNWLSTAQLCRYQLPRLKHLQIYKEERVKVSSQYVPAILKLISKPERPLPLFPPSSPTDTALVRESVSSLLSLSLYCCEFLPEDWFNLLMQLDLTDLTELSFENTNFKSQEMTTLIRRLPSTTASYSHGQVELPLSELNIRNSDLVKQRKILPRLETLLLERARGINVIIY